MNYILRAKILPNTKLYGIKPKVNQKQKIINYIVNYNWNAVLAGVLFFEGAVNLSSKLIFRGAIFLANDLTNQKKDPQ